MNTKRDWPRKRFFYSLWKICSVHARPFHAVDRIGSDVCPYETYSAMLPKVLFNVRSCLGVRVRGCAYLWKFSLLSASLYCLQLCSLLARACARIGGSRGGGALGHMPPRLWKYCCPPPPPNGKFSTIKNNCIFFWRIFKIKWLKSEEKLEFGGRLGWGDRPVALPQTDWLDLPLRAIVYVNSFPS